MKEAEEITAVITDKEEIQKIVDKFRRYSFSDLKERALFLFSLSKKY